ncbi:FHA domain protein [Leptolyngbya sp. PCC 7375]|nr:FHA domain protein [Leptolyngbya sp. PCC 7375]
MMLSLIEERPGRRPHTTNIDVDNLPATIGKSPEATYPIAVGVDPRTTYFRSVSRIHATLYKDSEGEIWLQDGSGQKPSENGCYHHGRRIYNPIRFYPGLQVELFPAISGYRLYVEMPSTKADGMEFETMGLEHEFLEQELKTADERVEQLTWAVSDLKQRLEQTSKFAHTLNNSIQVVQNELTKQQRVNLAQDAREKILRRILIAIAVLGFISAWVLLGGDQESLEWIGKVVVSVISFLGLIYGLREAKLDN